MSDSEFRFRNKRCDDCGFTKGTEANGHGLTAIKARLYAEVAEPFFCHFNATDDTGQLVIADGKEVLCRGWVDTCNELHKSGHYKAQTPFQREITHKLLDGISQIEEQQLTGEQGAELINRLLGI